MKQIRQNVFEMNSSSTHSIAIPKKCEAPRSVDFHTNEFSSESNFVIIHIEIENDEE